MQVPIGPDPGFEWIPQGGSHVAHTEFAPKLSVESQLKLRALYEYIESSRAALTEMQMDVSLLESSPDCTAYLKRTCDRLGNFCMEADSWGFNSLYEIALAVQMALLDSAERVQSSDFWKTVYRSLAMLFALLEHCETDFRWRLEIADMLDTLHQAK